MTLITYEGVFPFVAEHRSGTLLFCFHHAGGSASVYRGWVGADPRIDAVPVELPGKATRRGEKWISDFDRLVGQCATEILGMAAGMPFALYGHSMGAALAYQVASYLQQTHGATTPKAVVVAARQAPGETVPGEYHSSMGLGALRKELEKVGGTPPEILANDDVMKLLLADIRRDYVLHEGFHHSTTVLSCPVLALAGDRDLAVSPEMLSRWENFTSGRFELSVQPGGHFFPLDAELEFLDILAHAFARLTGDTARFARNNA